MNMNDSIDNCKDNEIFDHWNPQFLLQKLYEVSFFVFE